MDGLLPADHRNLSPHDIKVAEQLVSAISGLKSQNEMSLAGTTNYRENIDPRPFGCRFAG
jgi:hypothetical protein